MRWSSFLPTALALAGAATAEEHTYDERTTAPKTYIPASTFSTDVLHAKGLLNLAINSITNPQHTQCNLLNTAVRREWSTLSQTERAAYINAELCLMSKPSQESSWAPGAKSRYDDFVAVHINQTLTIHGTANFLSWHRYFTYAFEQALRNECGYNGYQPYWNWGKYAFDLLNSPLFDGSEYSMSGNGAYEAHNCTNALPTGLNCVPPGAGGGCVTSGPFKNMKVNLGPVSPTLAEAEITPAANPVGYNPRCLKRDISTWVSSNWTKDSDSYDLLTNYNDILSFQNRMQGDFASGYYGVHTGGHFSTNGDPGGDLFASPGEPTFFLHHAQIDRTWWIWQNQDLPKRQYALAGGTSLLNPNSPPGTLNDPIVLNSLAPQVKINDVMSTVAGPLCYIYV